MTDDEHNSTMCIFVLAESKLNPMFIPVPSSHQPYASPQGLESAPRKLSWGRTCIHFSICTIHRKPPMASHEFIKNTLNTSPSVSDLPVGAIRKPWNEEVWWETSTDLSWQRNTTSLLVASTWTLGFKNTWDQNGPHAGHVCGWGEGVI